MHFSFSSPPNCLSQAVVCLRIPRIYPRSEYFLVNLIIQNFHILGPPPKEDIKRGKENLLKDKTYDTNVDDLNLEEPLYFAIILCGGVILLSIIISCICSCFGHWDPLTMYWRTVVCIWESTKPYLHSKFALFSANDVKIAAEEGKIVAKLLILVRASWKVTA